MTPAQVWRSWRELRLSAGVARTLMAVITAAGLVLVIAVTPDSASGQVSGIFDTLRAPGEAGFVAGHRGDKEGAPENTLPAFEDAIASESAFVETDIQLTADDVPILMHDWTVDRTTNGTGPVWELTYNDIIRLDAGTWYDSKFAGTRVPTLEQFLILLQPSSKSAILELKGSWNVQQALIVTNLIELHGLSDRVIMASFDIMTLAALREAAPDLPRVIISHSVHGNPAALADACGAVAIVTSAAFIREHPEAVARIHDAGLGVLIYTLNNEDDWQHAVSLGADGLITDKPAKLAAWLGAPESAAARG